MFNSLASTAWPHSRRWVCDPFCTSSHVIWCLLITSKLVYARCLRPQSVESCTELRQHNTLTQMLKGSKFRTATHIICNKTPTIWRQNSLQNYFPQQIRKAKVFKFHWGILFIWVRKFSSGRFIFNVSLKIYWRLKPYKPTSAYQRIEVGHNILTWQSHSTYDTIISIILVVAVILLLPCLELSSVQAEDH